MIDMQEYIKSKKKPLRLRTYKGQGVKFKSEIYGQDRLLKIPNVDINIEQLNMYSEMDPLIENIPPMRGSNILPFLTLTRRKLLIPYILPIFPSLLYMEYIQKIVDRYMIYKYKRTKPDPDQFKKAIKDYAASLGFTLFGVTLLDRRFITYGNDHKFPYNTVIVLGMEMNKEWLMEAPHYKRNPTFDVYRRSSYRIHRVANFIRKQGVSCNARIAFDGAAITPPLAITAGLGELGAFGSVITEQYGPRQRWCLITIDFELPLDEPKDHGIANFCEKCLLCVKKCPTQAISKEKVWWRGVYKHKLNDLRCWTYSKRDTCGICLNICPLNRFDYKQVMEYFEKTGEVLGQEEILAEKIKI